MHPLLDDLTETQYADLYHVDDAPLPDVRQRTLRRLGWWTVALAVVGGAMGFVVRFPDMIKVPFVVKSEAAEAVYRFPATMYVEQTFVKPGQAVPAGAPLLDVSSPDVAALVNEYATARAALAQYRAFRTASTGNERRMLELTIAQLREDIRLKETQREVLAKKWAAEETKLRYEQAEAERLLAQNREFHRTGDISRNDLNGFEASRLRAQYAYQSAAQNFRQDERALRQQLETQELEINRLQTGLAKTTTDFRAEGAQLQSNLEAVRTRIEGRFGPFEVTPNHRLRLKAERAGTVSFVFDGEREAAAGAVVLKLMHRQAPLYAYAQVNSSRIGQVKAGQAVVLKLDAYPVYEWGTVRGRVSQVSLTPDEKGLFNVRVELTDYQRLNRRVGIGMQGTCNVIFDERTLYEYSFRRFREATTALVD